MTTEKYISFVTNEQNEDDKIIVIELMSMAVMEV